MFKNYLVSCLKRHYSIMCAKNISDSDHLGIVCCTVPWEKKWNKEGKPGFQIYAYLVSYVLSTTTNMQLSSYKLAVVASVPDIQWCLIYWNNIFIWNGLLWNVIHLLIAHDLFPSFLPSFRNLQQFICSSYLFKKIWQMQLDIMK